MNYLEKGIELSNTSQGNLEKAQARMKKQADKRRSEREFPVGEFVYLKLQPYRQLSVAQRKCKKLRPKYYWPFRWNESVQLHTNCNYPNTLK